jgi:hypothetical protein
MFRRFVIVFPALAPAPAMARFRRRPVCVTLGLLQPKDRLFARQLVHAKLGEKPRLA